MSAVKRSNIISDGLMLLQQQSFMDIYERIVINDTSNSWPILFLESDFNSFIWENILSTAAGLNCLNESEGGSSENSLKITD